MPALSHISKTPALLALACVLGAGLGAPHLAMAHPPAPAASSPMNTSMAEAPTISVTGEGRAAMAPDMAVISLSVVRMGDTAQAALTDNNAAMTVVMEALRGQGIAERDIQTSDFSIFPRYSQPDPIRPQDGSEMPKITGYQVSNSLTVRVRDLKKLGALLDQSIKLGINQGGQISFTNADPKGAMDEARRNAVTDAMAKAATLAQAAGGSLGPVISIVESSLRPEPMPLMRSMAMAKEADSVPVASGENTYMVLVEMKFSLAP
ncbi:SIMPL domain-containing protein [Rhizobium sp. FY34]|uniref:SIMPL domain-containing protein n=1 Tax=Rhizobium sp. FY34 TaxID=2562309 RepID=UPI0010C13B80|nr:SIMPL domain-containing protein [Rhizobium sp. FY34]